MSIKNLLMKEDALTGLFIRDELFSYLNKLISENRQFILGLIDLNNFKKINDKYGHTFGDGVLKYVASTIKLTLAERGVLFRYGGDEFIVIFPDQDKKYAYILFRSCNRILKKRPFLFGSKLLKISVSYGIASYPLDAVEIKTLIDVADKAMYCSKKMGKGAITDISRIWIVKVKFFFQRLLLITVLLVGVIYILGKTSGLGIKKMFPKTKPDVVEKSSSYSIKVLLRNGFVFKGELIDKDEKSLTLLIPMGEQKGLIKIERDLIRKYWLYRVKKID